MTRHLMLCILMAGTAHAAQAQSSASPFTVGYRYDAARQLVGIISPDPDGSGALRYAATRTTYNLDGKITKSEKGELASWQSEATVPSAWTGFTVFNTADTTYDNRDRKITESVSANGVAATVSQYSYDPADRWMCVAIRMNPAAFSALPASACNLGAQGSGSGDYGPDRITRNVYDAIGQLIQIRKAMGTSLEQAYATYSYTPNGKQEYVIDANGNRAKLIYDGFDRQVGWYFPSSTKPGAFNAATQATALATAGAASMTDYEAYGYDANGNRTSLRKRDGRTITYGYDALNRVALKHPATGSDTYYGYDLLGHQLYARFGSASGQGITDAYDGPGRKISSTSTMGGISRTLSYLYDADGNRTRITFPDGNYFVTTHDGLDRPTTIQQSGTTMIASEAWDAQGRRSGETRGAVSIGYGYDAISRLALLSEDLGGTAQDVLFCFGALTGSACTSAYNPANGIISRTISNDSYAWMGGFNLNRAYTTNGLNQYSTIAGAAQSYDANGNILSGGGVTYGYDIENRLVSASNGVSLAYDPLGRLFQMSGGSAGITQFLYDGDALVAEYDGSGTLLRRYIHGEDEDDPMLWYEGVGLTDRRSLQIDDQGSIVSVANSAGTMLSIDTYDEYGIPGDANVGRFQYTGQVWLPELGLYYYKARIYSPTLGRFLQTDPIGYKDQINLYAYVANDPVNSEDPSGECPWCVGAGIGLLIEGASQLADPSARASYAAGARALGNGDFGGALRAAGPNLAKLGFAAAAGAAGVGIAGKVGTFANALTKTLSSPGLASVANVAVRAIGNGEAGAIISGVNQAAGNLVSGQSISKGLAGAIEGGGVGGVVGSGVESAAVGGAQRLANGTGNLIGSATSPAVAQPGFATTGAERLGAVVGPAAEKSCGQTICK